MEGNLPSRRQYHVEIHDAINFLEEQTRLLVELSDEILGVEKTEPPKNPEMKTTAPSPPPLSELLTTGGNRIREIGEKINNIRQNIRESIF